jgi:quinol monooxygenase YgiN|tara:strand:- start:223 stop:522 length:300 start_codon:yes stop_codon:yes gene_type:complete
MIKEVYMLGVLATIKIKPGTNKKFEDAMRRMSEAVTDNEDGNYYYDIYRDDDVTYIVMEKYASQEDIDAHGKSDHMRSIGAEMGQFMAGPPEVKVLKSI